MFYPSLLYIMPIGLMSFLALYAQAYFAHLAVSERSETPGAIRWKSHSPLGWPRWFKSIAEATSLHCLNLYGPTD
jgi:hypothetical protein